MLLLYLDAYHLGDPLFLAGFARDVKAHRGPLLLAHGGGEEAERALEAAGFLATRRAGRLETDAPGAGALVERAVRDLNRRIVHELNEAGVAALRILGTDRGLLRLGEGGAVDVGRVGWLAALVSQRVVPVVGLLAERDGGAVESAPAETLVGLAGALAGALAEAEPVRDVSVGFLARGRRTGGGERGAPFSSETMPAAEVALTVSEASVRVRAVHPGDLRS